LCSVVPTFTHAEDLQALAAKLEQPNYPWRKEPAACSTLLRDLRKWAGIIVRQPLANTDALEDSRLKSYFGNCTASELVKRVEFEPRIWDSVKDLPEDERNKHGRTSRITKSFRLYRVNIDNDPKGIQELVITGAGTVYEANDGRGGDAILNVVNPSTCGISTSMNVPDLSRQRGLVELVRHQSREYVVLSRDFPNEKLQAITFWQWQYSKKTKSTFFAPACHFIAKD
jgi:hypothetical protein